MDKPGKIVRNTYNTLADKFDKWAESVRVEERGNYLNKVHNLFIKGSKILDVGCGNGLLDTLSLTKRFDVIGIDISRRQITEARKNVPDAKFIFADVRDYVFEPNSFDGIISFYCFNHIPRKSYNNLLIKFNRWLKPNGLLIASFGIGDTEGWIGEWLGTSTYFSSYNQNETIELINRNQFKIEEEFIDTAKEDDKEISFLWVLARNKK